ncbi:MAG: EamA family transporter [Litorilinea sp.]
MAAIFFAVLAHVGWGVGDVFGAVVSRRIGGYATTFWLLIVRIPVLAFYLPFDRDNLAALTWESLGWSAGLALVALVGAVLFFEALRVGNASLAGTIGSAFVVPTVLLSVIFLGETLSVAQALAVALITVGLVVTTLDVRVLRARQVVVDRGLVLALLAMLALGVYFAFIRLPVAQIGWFLPAYISFFFAPLVLLIMRFRKIPLQSPFARGVWRPFLILFSLAAVATFSYNIGVSLGYTAVVAPIAGSSPVTFAALSAWMFKETLPRRQLWGLVITLLGIVALSALA